MAAASQGVTRDQLIWFADAYIRPETYTAALARIINAHHALPILKPPVLAAVDLHQLANAVAPGAGLMDALSPLLAIHPQLGLDHPQAQCLATERNPMNLVQLLRYQSRAKIPITLANQCQ